MPNSITHPIFRERFSLNFGASAAMPVLLMAIGMQLRSTPYICSASMPELNWMPRSQAPMRSTR